MYLCTRFSPYTLVWPRQSSCTCDLHVPRPDTDHRSVPRPLRSTESVCLCDVGTNLCPLPSLCPPWRSPPGEAGPRTASRAAYSAHCPTAPDRSTPCSPLGPARAPAGTAEGKPGTDGVRRAAGESLRAGSLGTGSCWRVKTADRLTFC